MKQEIMVPNGRTGERKERATLFGGDGARCKANGRTPERTNGRSPIFQAARSSRAGDLEGMVMVLWGAVRSHLKSVGPLYPACQTNQQ